MGAILLDGAHIPFPEDTFNAFLEKWKNGTIPKSPGKHAYDFHNNEIDYNKGIITLKSRIEYSVSHRHHFKFFVPTDYRGLKDYITSNFNPSYMTFTENIPYLNDGTWRYVSNPKEISINTKYLDIEIIDIGFLKRKLLHIAWEDNGS